MEKPTPIPVSPEEPKSEIVDLDEEVRKYEKELKEEVYEI